MAMARSEKVVCGICPNKCTALKTNHAGIHYHHHDFFQPLEKEETSIGAVRRGYGMLKRSLPATLSVRYRLDGRGRGNPGGRPVRGKLKLSNREY